MVELSVREGCLVYAQLSPYVFCKEHPLGSMYFLLPLMEVADELLVLLLELFALELEVAGQLLAADGLMI